MSRGHHRPRAFAPITGYDLFLINHYHKMGWSRVSIESTVQAEAWAQEFEATMAREYAILTDPTSPAEVEACAAMMVSSARWE